MENRYCIILAGGIGTKLWPRSRRRRPKQFLDPMGSEKSLIRQTYERFLPLVKPENFLVVTTLAYRDMLREELPELNPEQVLCEPAGRNTAAAICYAAYTLQRRDPDAMMVITPADHYVSNPAEFLASIKRTVEFAHQRGVITTIGVKPSHPETRYGYIQTSNNKEISRVKCFTEKPTLEVAMQFMHHREFYWNTGLLVCTPRDMISAIAEHLEELHSLFESIKPSLGTSSEAEALDQIYAECKPISIDHGVIRRARNIYVCCVDIAWSDIGTWGAVHDLSAKDARGNATGEGVFTFDTDDSYISTQSGKTAVVSGLAGYIIVDTEDLLMVCPRSQEQNIKQFIDEVKFYKSSKKI